MDAAALAARLARGAELDWDARAEPPRARPLEALAEAALSRPELVAEWVSPRAAARSREEDPTVRPVGPIGFDAVVLDTVRFAPALHPAAPYAAPVISFLQTAPGSPLRRMHETKWAMDAMALHRRLHGPEPARDTRAVFEAVREVLRSQYPAVVRLRPEPRAGPAAYACSTPFFEWELQRREPLPPGALERLNLLERVWAETHAPYDLRAALGAPRRLLENPTTGARAALGGPARLARMRDAFTLLDGHTAWRIFAARHRWDVVVEGRELRVADQYPWYHWGRVDGGDQRTPWNGAMLHAPELLAPVALPRFVEFAQRLGLPRVGLAHPLCALTVVRMLRAGLPVDAVLTRDFELARALRNDPETRAVLVYLDVTDLHEGVLGLLPGYGLVPVLPARAALPPLPAPRLAPWGALGAPVPPYAAVREARLRATYLPLVWNPWKLLFAADRRLHSPTRSAEHAQVEFAPEAGLYRYRGGRPLRYVTDATPASGIALAPARPPEVAPVFAPVALAAPAPECGFELAALEFNARVHAPRLLYLRGVIDAAGDRDALFERVYVSELLLDAAYLFAFDAHPAVFVLRLPELTFEVYTGRAARPGPESDGRGWRLVSASAEGREAEEERAWLAEFGFRADEAAAADGGDPLEVRLVPVDLPAVVQRFAALLPRTWQAVADAVRVETAGWLLHCAPADAPTIDVVLGPGARELRVLEAAPADRAPALAAARVAQAYSIGALTADAALAVRVFEPFEGARFAETPVSRWLRAQVRLLARLVLGAALPRV